MAQIHEPLSDFIPDLPQLRNIVTRFSARLGEDAWPQYLSYLGEASVDNVKSAMIDKGIRSRTGHLLDSVKFDMNSGDFGTVGVETEYASSLDQGFDMKESNLLGKTVRLEGMYGSPSPIFRTVSNTPNSSRGFKNWEIQPYRFMELAKQVTAGSVIQVVEEIKQMASPTSSVNYEMPTEELPEVSKETWLALIPDLRDDPRFKETGEPPEEYILPEFVSEEDVDKQIQGMLEVDPQMVNYIFGFDEEAALVDDYIKGVAEGWASSILI